MCKAARPRLVIGLTCIVAGFVPATVSGVQPQQQGGPATNSGFSVDLGRSVIVFSALVDEQWDLFAWNPDGSSPPDRLTHSPDDELRPSLAADRRSIVYETTDGRLTHLDLITGVSSSLPFASEKNFDMQPAVCPDGRSVLVTTSLSRKLDDTNLALITMDDNHTVRQLHFPSSQFLPCWAPDEEQFAFVHLHARGWVGRVTTEIWLARLEPPMAKQLTMLDGLTIDPSWTSDGKRVLFASNAEGQFDIYSVDAVSRKVIRLTHHPSADTDPVSSPDGKTVLFVSTRSGSLGLFLLREGEPDAKEVRPFGEERTRCKDPDWR